jgi:hypothetical protein
VTQTADAEQPTQPFDGAIGIEWPAGSGTALPAWKVAPFDADGVITTITEFTLHLRADEIIWAAVTMFADPEGKPVYRAPPDGKLHTDDDGIVTGTFRFLVTEMRVRETPAAPH